MAITKKLVHFKKLETFNQQKDSGNISEYSIVFIQDANLIWTHDTFYGAIPETFEASDYEGQDGFELLKAGDSYKDAISKLDHNIDKLVAEVIDNEETIATAVSQLDTRTKIGDSFVPATYPEGTDKTFEAVSAGESLEVAFGKLDRNVATTVGAIVENEIATAGILSEICGYSESPTKIGSFGYTGTGNSIFRKVLYLQYSNVGSSQIFTNAITSDTSGVTVLDLNCTVQQTVGSNGSISYDYRSPLFTSSNSNSLNYYYKHSTGELVIEFSSTVSTALVCTVVYSCSTSLDSGNSIITGDEVLDGGTSAASVEDDDLLTSDEIYDGGTSA